MVRAEVLHHLLLGKKLLLAIGPGAWVVVMVGVESCGRETLRNEATSEYPGMQIMGKF